MNTKYDIEDITDRLQDLRNYLSGLESELSSAQDAVEDMERYAADIEERVNLPTIPEAEQLRSELHDYIAEHRHEWDYRTERFFNRLDWLVMQTLDDTSPEVDEDGNFISVHMAMSPKDIQTLHGAVDAAVQDLECSGRRTAEDDKKLGTLQRMKLRLAPLLDLATSNS